MTFLLRFLFRFVLVGFVIVAVTFAYFYWAMTINTLSGKLPAYLTVEQGNTTYDITQKLASQQVNIPSMAFRVWARVTSKAGQLKAGTYLLKDGMTPLQLLNNMVDGKSQLSKITIVEGWTFQKMRQAINKHPDIVHDTQGWSDEKILKAIGAPNIHPEGLFFPDTYHFAPKTTDLAIFKQAYEAMQAKLAAGWEARDPATPYQDIYEALIVASLVEKETGHPEDRSKIAGVFVNRIRKNMKLQSDPTVIYGMGERYQGRIRKVDLTTDTPYNTYTRHGLPPTPIALPGYASIEATLRPEKTNALFFVAKGDDSGRSHFSADYQSHQAGVKDYWQRRKENAAQQ